MKRNIGRVSISAAPLFAALFVCAALFAGCAPQVQDSAGKVLDNAGTVVQPGLQKVWEPTPGAPPIVTQPESEKAKGK